MTLRNVAFHHEPIFDRSTLLADHAAIYVAMGWIEPAMVAPTQLFDHVLDTHTDARAIVESTIKTHLGM